MANSPPAAVVTGAASGIGRALVVRLASEGYRLILVDRDHAGLQQLLAELPTTGPIDHELVVADVSDAAAWRGLADTLAHDKTDVAILVQAAGGLLAGRLVDCPPEEIERLIAVNLTAVALGSQAIGPLLIKQALVGARSPLPRGVLNVASIFGAVSPPGFAVYNATKAGVVALTETLRGEGAPHGLTATAILPGVTPTRLFDNAVYANEPLREAATQRVAQAELTADYVAEMALRAYAKRRLVVPIGKRASRYYWLKRWLPNILLKRVAAEANRELGG